MNFIRRWRERRAERKRMKRMVEEMRVIVAELHSLDAKQLQTIMHEAGVQLLQDAERLTPGNKSLH